MKMLQVQALYDFEAQPGTGELSLTSGDILNVTRRDVGEGWWEGTNAKGESGLFPEAYVEVTNNRLLIFEKLVRYTKIYKNLMIVCSDLFDFVFRITKLRMKAPHQWLHRHFLQIMEASPMQKRT